MVEQRDWARTLGKSFEQILSKLAVIELQTATLLLNLYREDALITDLKAQRCMVETLHVELESELETWRAEQQALEIEGADPVSMQSAYAVSLNRIELLLNIRRAQFPRWRERQQSGTGKEE